MSVFDDTPSVLRHLPSVGDVYEVAKDYPHSVVWKAATVLPDFVEWTLLYDKVSDLPKDEWERRRDTFVGTPGEWSKVYAPQPGDVIEIPGEYPHSTVARVTSVLPDGTIDGADVLYVNRSLLPRAEWERRAKEPATGPGVWSK